MAAEIVVRWLGENIEEGVIAAWHKNVGDRVVQGDVLVEIKTSKSTREYRSDARGTLLHQGAVIGQKIKLNDILAVIGRDGENIQHHIHPGQPHTTTIDLEGLWRRRQLTTGKFLKPTTPEPSAAKPSASKSGGTQPPTSKPPASKPPAPTQSPAPAPSVKTYKKVFFSYARTDSEIVMKLAADLKKKGINVWLDQLDIRPGKVWDVEVERALETCDCLLFIVSEASVGSENVLNEVHYAIEEHKTVLPVLISNCKIPFRVRRLHHVDLITNYEAGLKQLLTALQL
jgi:pyruvate/2-oxoglutarate dehydrogenase complex dihydrolipoamide acyltransferase (E2) component